MYLKFIFWVIVRDANLALLVSDSATISPTTIKNRMGLVQYVSNVRMAMRGRGSLSFHLLRRCTAGARHANTIQESSLTT